VYAAAGDLHCHIYTAAWQVDCCTICPAAHHLHTAGLAYIQRHSLQRTYTSRRNSRQDTTIVSPSLSVDTNEAVSAAGRLTVLEAVCSAARCKTSRCCSEVLLLLSTDAARCCFTDQRETLGIGRRAHSQTRMIMTAKTAAAAAGAGAAGIRPGRLMKLLSKQCTISKGWRQPAGPHLPVHQGQGC
jgi:hypothetical protein